MALRRLILGITCRKSTAKCSFAASDRSFDVSHSEHIDRERAERNVYWDCCNGYRQLAEKNSDEIEMASTFEKVEQLYYHNRYTDYTVGQNARNEKNRHTERNHTTDEILKNKKTCPEESLLQIGKMEEHAPAETLFLVATEFFAEFEERFGSHVHILDWALHIDEQPLRSVEEVKASLESAEKGGVRQSIRNCLTVFQCDPLLAGAVAYNVLTERKDIVKPVGFERTGTALTETVKACLN